MVMHTSYILLIKILTSVALRMPYGLIRIENDKVGLRNKQENWTKPLKYTLCDLKWALFWFIGNTNCRTKDRGYF